MKPVIEVGGARVFLGDCRDVLRTLPDNSVDSIVTDPPYGLGFMGKKWDTFGGKAGISESVAAKIQGRYREKAPGTPRYAGTARPAKPSDGEMLAFQLWCTEWAVECLRVLKPGGHLLAFGGSRTWHRLAVAVEDAGFELRDSIAWIYGSGFPKSLDVSKAIDKGHGANKERQLQFVRWMRETGLKASEINDIIGKSDVGSHYLRFDQPAIATADLFDKLRPYLPEVPEYIERLVAERTGIEWTAYKQREVIGQHEAPAKSIYSQGKIELQKEVAITAPATSEAVKWQGWGTALKPAFEPVVVGRKPLVGTVAENVLTWGVGGLNIDGSRIGSDDTRSPASKSALGMMNDDGWEAKSVMAGSAHGRWPANVILDEVTAGLLDEQSGVSKSPATYVRNADGYGQTSYGLGESSGTSSLNYGDSGGASRFFYVAKASKRDRNEGLEDLPDHEWRNDGAAIPQRAERPFLPSKNHHPTVKPTQLMRYLIKLVTPPGGTVLDPFTGSGSTGKAALLDGFGFVGVELTEEYLPIIEGRLRWASKQTEDDTLF